MLFLLLVCQHVQFEKYLFDVCLQRCVFVQSLCQHAPLEMCFGLRLFAKMLGLRCVCFSHIFMCVEILKVCVALLNICVASRGASWRPARCLSEVVFASSSEIRRTFVRDSPLQVVFLRRRKIYAD